MAGYGADVHVLSVVGARPQFVKLAPVAEALALVGARHTVVHTGQHYDAAMSAAFFADLHLPTPDVHLGVGSAPHGVQTASILASLEPVLARTRPDWVLVYGDTNSTLAAALAAVKLGLSLAHLEAGLRSGNRAMPEEHNRVLTDHAADLLLAPSRNAVEQLAREGLASRCRLVGDVMVDVCLRVAASVEPVRSAGDVLLATVHRAENTDDPVRLRMVLDGLARLPLAVLLPVHPRLRDRARSAGLSLDAGALRPVEPLPYRRLIGTVLASAGVVTDSGGLQKEAHVLGVPCTTLRSETEWVETLEGGWNVLAPDPCRLGEVVMRARPGGKPPRPYGDGDSAARVVAELASPATSAASRV